MKSLQGLIQRVDNILKILLVVMLALLVIDVSWQILTRFVLPKPSSFTEEVARFLLIWISLVGGALAYRMHSHLGFDLIMRSVKPTKAVLMFKLCCILVSLFAFAVLIVGGSNLVYLTWILGQSSPVLNVPMAFVYGVIPFSGLLFLLYSTYFFADAHNQYQGEVS